MADLAVTQVVPMVTKVSAASVNTPVNENTAAFNDHKNGVAWRHADDHIDVDTVNDATTLDVTASNLSVSLGRIATGLKKVTHPDAATWIAALLALSADENIHDMYLLLHGHSHADATHGGKLSQSNTHESADTDSAPTSIHHTLGTGANQAAAGNHNHDAIYSKISDIGTSVAGLIGGLINISVVPSTIARTSDMTTADNALSTSIAGKSSIAHTHGSGGEATITSGGIANDAVTNSKILDSSVTTAKVNDAAITEAKIANNAVTSVKILDANVTTAKINDSAITTAKITDLNVTTGKIADGAVTAVKIANNVITTSKIDAAGLDTSAFKDGSVTSIKIADASVSPDKLSEGYVAQEGSGTLRVLVNSLHRWNSSRGAVYWPGGYVDLSTAVAGLTAGQRVYVLIEINSTPIAIPVVGEPVTGALGDINRPLKDPDTTGVAFVALYYGQTSIMQTDITQFRGTDGGDGATGGGSQVGHIHGQSNESRIGAIGLDQGFPHAFNPPSMSFIIEPKQYENASGVSVLKGQTTIGPITNPSSGYRIIPYYLDPSTGSYIAGTVSDDPTNPVKPSFSGNQDPICYIHTRAGATVVKDGDDGVNAYIEDARVWTRGGLGVSSLPIGVSDGGSGQSTFAQGLMWQSNASVGTTPLTTIPATNSTTKGLAITPAVTGMSAASTVYDIELGGGTITHGATALARIIGTHALAPVKSGAGTVTSSVSLQVELPSNGTSNASAIFAGSVKFGATTMPATTVDIAGTLGISGTTAGVNPISVSETNVLQPAATSTYAIGHNLGFSVDTSVAGITNYAGLYINPATKTGAGTITTAIGLSVYAPTAGATNYAASFTGNVNIAGNVSFDTNSRILQESWIAPTLLNSWVNNGGGTSPAGYYKDSEGVVHVQGFIKSGVIGNSAFAFNTGYAPVTIKNGATTSGNLFGSYYIAPSGFFPYVGTNAGFAIDSITFDTRV